MLKGEEDFLEENEEGSLFETETSLIKEPMPVVYNPKIPIETFDFIVVDECHRIDLQHLAAGAGILRCLPHRPDRHADHRRPSASSTAIWSRTTATSRPWLTASTSATTSTASRRKITKDGAKLVQSRASSSPTATAAPRARSTRNLTTT